MFKALRFFGWPLLAGVLIALLIIQRYPQWVGLPSLDVNLQQAPQTSYMQQGPVTYADAVVRAAPAVAHHPCDPQIASPVGHLGNLSQEYFGGAKRPRRYSTAGTSPRCARSGDPRPIGAWKCFRHGPPE